MVISHRYRYVFVELPLTGSTAISRELCDMYSGEKILFKHATYRNFIENATSEESAYFVFSCIRNPLDQTVSYYFKYKTDHQKDYTDSKKLSRYRGLYQSMLKSRDLGKYTFVKKRNASFGDFFLRYYRLPFSNWSILDHKNFDYVIRFESLQSDFSEVLSLLGVEQLRPLPYKNSTSQKGNNYLQYYDSSDVRDRAKRVLGPFMAHWGYEFPDEWGKYIENRWHRYEYGVLNLFRKLVWIHLRKGKSFN